MRERRRATDRPRARRLARAHRAAPTATSPRSPSRRSEVEERARGARRGAGRVPRAPPRRPRRRSPRPRRRSAPPPTGWPRPSATPPPGPPAPARRWPRLAAAREEQARSEAGWRPRARASPTSCPDIAERLELRAGRPARHGRAGRPTPTARRSRGVERRLDGLRQDRERLGAVNLRAEEELAEIEAQREALAAERDDLIEAIKRLRGAIESLNREGRERLLAAFTIVHGHFQRLFTTLFGGGTAQLELIESDDPLEAGLEILARPPGKKPQTMTLLSGGEQALTAIALIFAVFLTNPVADLRARRGRRAARRRQCRALLRPAARHGRQRPRPASSSSPTTPSPWRAWTACSA